MLVTGVNQDEKSFLLKKAEKNTAYANTGEEFVIRIGATCDAAHAITIVGYDDNKGIDINGDRKVTGAEKGAFKVRNSWGTNAHNNGEYWVLYDAIVNSTSQIETSSDLYAEENFKEVELRRIVTEEDGQTITTGFCAYVDNVTTAAIEIGDRDSLSSFLTVRNLPALPKDENGLYNKQWLRDRISEICCGDTLTSEEEKIVDDYFYAVKESWNEKLYKYCQNKDLGSDVKIVLPRNWEDVLAPGHGSRGRMFTVDACSLDTTNYYCFITVAPKEVHLVGEVDYQLSNYYEYQLNFSCENQLKSVPSRNMYYEEDRENLSIETTEVIDLTDISRNNMLGEKTWIAELILKNGNSSDYLDFKLTDDLGNVVGTGTSDEVIDGKRVAKVNTNLQVWDLDYNNLLTIDDVKMEWNLLNKLEEGSLLQEILADCNQNGIIDKADFFEMLNLIKQQMDNNDTTFVNITSAELESFVNECITVIEAGDNNYDGYITVTDFESIQYYLKGDYSFNALQKKLFDYNCDNKIDINDVYDMLNCVCEALLNHDDSIVHISMEELYGILNNLGYKQLGDVSLDGIINEQDVLMLKDMLDGVPVSSLQMILGDIDKDGSLTKADIKLLYSIAFFVDVNNNGIYSVEDINSVLYHISGIESLSYVEKNCVDFNADGEISREEYYMLLYGYYLHIDSNPGLSREEFYSDFMYNNSMMLGDMNSSGNITTYDLETFQKTIDGEQTSYLHLILADVNMDLKLDEADKTLYYQNYMSEIPFTYIIDSDERTMFLTGVKDSNITYIQIPETYTIDRIVYTVTGIEKNAFSQCESLEEIYIPDSVVSITGKVRTESPFYGINGNVLKIYCETSSKPDGYETYWAAGQRIEYGYTIKNADDYFYFTLDETNKSMTITGIKGLYAKEKVITIDDRYLVAGIEYQVTAIGDSAFEYVGMGESLESIRLPAGIAVIGQWAFASNINLQDIDLGRCVHLREIKASAFAYCSKLDEVWIPASVEIIQSDSIEESIFYQCDSNLIIYTAAPELKELWGKYWNYISENQMADVIYGL